MLVRGWRRWGSATGECLPECLELVVSRLGGGVGGRGTWGIHTHSEPRARLLLWYLLFGEHVCLSDPQSPHLFYEEVELVWWSPKYHMGKFHMKGKRKMEPPLRALAGSQPGSPGPFGGSQNLARKSLELLSPQTLEFESSTSSFQSQYPVNQLCDLGQVASPLWSLL